MLTKPFNLKGIVPNKVDGAIKVNAAADFTKKLTKYSELISNSKKTSAANSISSFLSKTLDQAQQMSTSEECNSNTHRPNLFHNYTIQVQVKKEVHEKNVMEGKQNDFDVYKFCDLLHTKEWEEYCKNPLSDKFKIDFLDKMTKQSDYNLSKLSKEEKKVKINNYPSFGIKWDSMTLDVGDIKGGNRQVDPRHYNGY
jgi:hypothetical protein